ncbi:MAG TPA: Holliday junction resolvase RuvX [Polyangiaceae bacterium]|nr:Holliday junction resolvase RuvX [Polyangiaceae bacterium]
MRRAIGVDFGLRRVGIAVADELGTMAHARPYLDGRDIPKLIAALCELAKTEAISTFVIGLPKSMAGSEGLPALRVRRFAAALAKQSGAKIEFMDERLSTVEASARLREQGLDSRKMKDRIDGAAAAILLQSWLDSPRQGS